MIDDIRPIARAIHLLFSLVAFLVVWELTLHSLSDRRTSLLRYGASFCLALSAALAMHYALDVAVGVP